MSEHAPRHPRGRRGLPPLEDVAWRVEPDSPQRDRVDEAAALLEEATAATSGPADRPMMQAAARLLDEE